jgi:preprotein translocase subunit SecG
MLSFFLGLANVLMILTSLFLICLVLIQRGKGGGLAGAFGGVGGSSAFGTKAGDVFTRVTIYVACFWFLLAMVLVWSSNTTAPTSAFNTTAGDSSAADDVPKAPSSDKDEVIPTPRLPKAESKPTDGASQPLNPGKAGISETTDAPAKPPATKP